MGIPVPLFALIPKCPVVDRSWLPQLRRTDSGEKPFLRIHPAITDRGHVHPRLYRSPNYTTTPRHVRVRTAAAALQFSPEKREASSNVNPK
jgi:hypothetical protein